MMNYSSNWTIGATTLIAKAPHSAAHYQLYPAARPPFRTSPLQKPDLRGNKYHTAAPALLKLPPSCAVAQDTVNSFPDVGTQRRK